MKFHNSRLNIFLFFVFVLAATVVGRLFYLQVLNHKLYSALALGQQSKFNQVSGNRGQIFLEESKESRGSYASSKTESLAINQDNWLAFAVPKDIKNKDNFKKILSQNIGESKEFIDLQMAKSDSYAIIKKDLSAKEVQSLKNLNLDGLYFNDIVGRYYPQKNLASQAVGFVGGDSKGQYGVEGYYDDVLKGKTGIQENKNGLGLIGSDVDATSLNGSDIYLTIDYNIQFQAEAVLRQAFDDFHIESGQVIVMKPDSGRILALANFPSFDPNQYSQQTNLEIFQNSTVQKLFEPGSVFKPLTMSMALNEGKVSPQTTFVDTGSDTIGDHTIHNFDHKSYGRQDMSGILEKSINTGAVFLSKLMSHQTFLDYIDKFGLNEKTGIGLQGEVSSRNEILKNGPELGFATASFGQGIEMTPIQLLTAFSVLANGGKMARPYIVDKIVNGQDELDTKSEISGQIISSKTASEVTTMMTNVVERGFGKGAKIPGYWLAGKTGTAEIPLKNGRGYYSDGRTIQSFIGFGPSLKPQFLILVKLDDPKVPESSLSAVPIFKKLAKFIIDYWQIPPDYQQ